MDGYGVAIATLRQLRSMHDRDHECHDGGWIKPDRLYLGGQDVAPEWPCPTLAVIERSLGEAPGLRQHVLGSAP